MPNKLIPTIVRSRANPTIASARPISLTIISDKLITSPLFFSGRWEFRYPYPFRRLFSKQIPHFSATFHCAKIGLRSQPSSSSAIRFHQVSFFGIFGRMSATIILILSSSFLEMAITTYRIPQ